MQNIVDFLLELDKLKGVTRKILPLGQERYENSAEHSWHLAMAAISLQPYAESPVNISHVIAMLLVHDIGEIETGDTMAFVEEGWVERKNDELAAVTRIFGMLPNGAGGQLLELWKEFEHGDTPESRFANAIDRAMPVLMNLANHGQSWRENDISHERVVRRVRGQIEAGSPKLWAYLEKRLDDVRELGYFGAP